MSANCPPDFVLPPPTQPSDHPPTQPALSPTIKLLKQSQFSRVDGYVDSLNQLKFASFRELMWKLVFSHKWTDLEIARVVFHWLADTPLKEVEFCKQHLCPPEKAFYSYINGENIAFSLLYQLLISHAGLYCAQIIGYAKGCNYLPGDQLESKPPNHSWNAVFANQQWNLVDVQWGKQAMRIGNVTLDQGLVDAYEDYYFFTDPYQAIYSHYPLEKKWQLLDGDPVTIQTFESLPAIKPNYFHQGLLISDCPRGVLSTQTGNIKIAWHHESMAEFMFKLQYKVNHELVEVFCSRSLQQCVLLETEIGLIVAHIHLPFVGEYYFTLFSAPVHDLDDLNINRFQALCLYKLVCEHTRSDLYMFSGYPNTSVGAFWPLVMYYGCYPISHHAGVLNITLSEAITKENLEFYVEQKDVTLLPKLRQLGKNFKESHFIDSMITTSCREDLVNFEVILPNEGMFVFELFVSKSNNTDRSVLVCQYLLIVQRELTVARTPLFLSNTEKGCSLPDPYRCTPALPCEMYASLLEKYRVLQERFAPGTLKNIAEEDGAYSSPPDDFRVYMISPVDPCTDITPAEMPKSDFGGLMRKGSDGRDITETLSVSRRSQNDFRELLWELIFSRDLKSDEDKIRAIFVWLVSKDLNTLDFQNAPKGSPESLLMRIKAGSATYAEAFTILCRHASIKSRTINGYAKGIGYHPGMKVFRNTSIQHSWNVAQVDQRWHLFDCQWAARRVSDRWENINDLLYTVDEFFYMADPDQLKMSHYPLDPKWQLTDNPISMPDFERYAPVKSAYFLIELSLKSHEEGLLELEVADLEIIIGMNPKNYLKLEFAQSMKKLDDTNVKFEDLSMNCFNLPHTNEEPARSFLFVFPGPGIYALTLFVRDNEYDTYHGFVEYRVVTDFVPLGDDLVAFPQEVVQSCGPTPLCVEKGIKVMSSFSDKCYIDSYKSYFEIDLQHENEEFLAGKLCNSSFLDDELGRCVLKRVIGHDPENKGFYRTKFLMIFPVVGKFAFVVREAIETENKDRQLIYTWLIDNHRPIDASNILTIPSLPEDLLGPLPIFFEMGFQMKYPYDPLILVPLVYGKDEFAQNCPIGDFEVSIIGPPGHTKPGPTNIRVVGELTMCLKGHVEKRLTDYLLQQTDEEEVKFLARFPIPGTYKLSIYAQPLPDESDLIPIVCTFMFVARHRRDPRMMPYIGAWRGKYPKQTQKWKENGILKEPMDEIIIMRDRKTLSTVPFECKLLRAKDVIVMYDEIFYPLHPTQLENSEYAIWKGDVPIPKEEDKTIIVAGRWTTQKTNYPILLEYKVKV